MNTDPFSAFNLNQFIGLAAAPTIERFVEYLKREWKLPTYLTAPVSVLTGILINVGLATYFSVDFKTALLIGAFTGLFASGWHEIAKN